MVDEIYFTAPKYVIEIFQEVTKEELDQIRLYLWRQLVKEVELFDDQIVVIAERAKQFFFYLIVES